MDPLTVERLYFAAFIALVILLVAGCQWAAFYFFNIKGAIVSGTLLSVAAGMAWLYFVQFARAQNTTGASGSIPEFRIFATALLMGIVCISVLSIGIYYLVIFQKTGALNKPVFFIWLAFVIIVPSAYFGLNIAHEQAIKQDLIKHYADLSLKIFHLNEYPVYIDQLIFVNDSTKRQRDGNVYSKIYYTSPEMKEELSVSERVFSWEQTIFDENIDIPLNADKILLSYYSYTEDRYYQDTIPFDFQKYTYVNDLTGKNIAKGIEIFILPEGNGRIIIPSENIYFPYSKVATAPIDNEQRDWFIEFFVNRQMLKDGSEYEQLIKEINASDRLKEGVDMMNSVFHWDLDVSTYGLVVGTDITDFNSLKYKANGKWFKENPKKSLPATIIVEVKNDSSFCRIYIYPDRQKLYQAVKELTANQDVKINLEINAPEKDSVKMLIGTKDQRMPFSDLYVNVVKFDS